MNRRGRTIVLALSIPIVVFVAVGGFMSRAMAAREDSYQHLRIFEDVVTLITNNYVEEVDLDKVMRGAMHGVADGVDLELELLEMALVGKQEEIAMGDLHEGHALRGFVDLRLHDLRDSHVDGLAFR